LGELHLAQAPPSSLQVKVDPASLELKPKEDVSALVELLGPETIVVCGSVVSVGAGGVAGVLGGVAAVLGWIGAEGWLGWGTRWRRRLGRSPIRW
jgi:hypothetical protein